MSEPKFYTVFEADSAYLKALGDTNTYFSEFEVRLKTLEALGGKIDNSITSLLEVEKKILETVGGIATTTNDIFELRKEIAKAQGLDVSEDFNIWDVAQQEPPVGPRIFTIRFLNWDGTVLETVEVEEGQTPVYGGTEPTKESDETYNYTFNGWLPEISPANGNVDYVAQFTAVEIPTITDDITLPYVTFVAEEAGSTLGLNKIGTTQTLAYSTNKSTWNTLDTSSTITLANVGDEVYVRGVQQDKNSVSNYIQFKMTGKIAAYGNINALWDYEDLNAPLKNYCGYNMFAACSSLTKAPELPATTLARSCYNSMFKDCTSLTQAPELPATTLATYCYTSMFQGCTSLTQAPELPVTKLFESCYNAMFMGCTSLTQAPELPATTLASYCYNSMFNGCTSLTKAPELPATTLASSCYNQMFYDCTSLTQAPELPATTLAQECYNYMFRGCTSLTKAPELPAATLAKYCYSYMFYGCTALTEAPELPATTATRHCYAFMFKDCTSLTQAPELPATTLDAMCYQGMFYGCTSLTKAPELPATTVTAMECYQYMFYGCTSLQEITCLATNITSDSLNVWVSNVSSTGTFYKDPSMTSWPYGSSGIPKGWTVVDYAG